MDIYRERYIEVDKQTPNSAIGGLRLRRINRLKAIEAWGADALGHSKALRAHRNTCIGIALDA